MKKQTIFSVLATGILILTVILRCEKSQNSQNNKPSENSGPTVNVNGSEIHQTIEGLGGLMENHLGYEKNTQFWDLLFNDIGVSALRIHGWVDFETNPYIEESVGVAREAKNHGVRTFAFDAGPPPQWKVGPNGEPGALAGGTLKPEYYDKYSNYLLDHIKWFRDNAGIDINYIVPFGEPNWLNKYDPNGVWAYCYMTETAYRDFLKVMGPIFRKANSPVKICAPVGNRVPVTISYGKTIFSDPISRQYVDIFATNSYEWPYSTNAQSWQQLHDLAEQYGKTDIMNWEVCHASGQMPAPDAAGIYTATWVHEGLVYGNVKVYYWWLMVDKGKYSAGGIRGFVYSKDWPCKDGVCEFNSDGITKQGYAFKQFAHWVRPGSIRVGAGSSDSHVLASAYKHPTDNTIAIVAINDDNSSKTVSFNIANLVQISGLNVFRTSETEDSAPLGSVSVKGNSFVYTLPQKSITTFNGSLTGTQ